MTKPLRLDDDAAEELEVAATWYEARREGLGGDFIAAIRDACHRVIERPDAYSLAAGVPSELGVRRCLLRRFPFAIVYVELDAEIRVLAIAHTSREPGYWRSRL